LEGLTRNAGCFEGVSIEKNNVASSHKRKLETNLVNRPTGRCPQNGLGWAEFL
jgi:hypothetical protein